MYVCMYWKLLSLHIIITQQFDDLVPTGRRVFNCQQFVGPKAATLKVVDAYRIKWVSANGPVFCKRGKFRATGVKSGQTCGFLRNNDRCIQVLQTHLGRNVLGELRRTTPELPWDRRTWTATRVWQRWKLCETPVLAVNLDSMAWWINQDGFMYNDCVGFMRIYIYILSISII